MIKQKFGIVTNAVHTVNMFKPPNKNEFGLNPGEKPKYKLPKLNVIFCLKKVVMKEVDKKAAKDNKIKNKKISNSLPMDIDDDFERIVYNDNNK